MDPLQIKLTALDQCSAPMIWSAPAASEDLDQFEVLTGISLPAPLRRLLLLTDGAELNVPGTRFYTLHPVLPSLFPQNLPGLLEAMDEYHDFMERGFFPLGITSFGDPLFLVRATGEVVQWDHEADEEFLRWPDLESYLDDELDACLS